MQILGNILWLIFGGLFIFIFYALSGLLLCCTIIGIPFGFQIFKLAIFAIMPFGRTTTLRPDRTGCLMVVMNVLWLLIGGLFIAVSHLIVGVILCCTIIGIPFGLQHFKLAEIALLPFGREIIDLPD